MLHLVVVWFLVVGFTGAGLINVVGTPALRSSFVRWGYPSWWGRVTGALEVASAVLIAIPAGREAGLAVGAMIIGAAILTVLRAREFSHLVPLTIFVATLALADLST